MENRTIIKNCNNCHDIKIHPDLIGEFFAFNMHIVYEIQRGKKADYYFAV